MPNSNGTEQLVLACECGATVKASVAKGRERSLTGIEAMWRVCHPTGVVLDGSYHGPVSCGEARRLRDAARKAKQ